MDIKPKKPDQKIVEPIKDIEKTIAKSKSTKVDTKALESANKELKAAAEALGKAMGKVYKDFGAIHIMAVDVAKTPAPAGPIPIPYPVISKAEKKSKSALTVLENAQARHKKVGDKFIKLIDQEAKVLTAGAKPTAGDEAGTLKGLISAKAKVKAQLTSASFDVKVEGKNMIRCIDMMNKNIKKLEKK